MVEVIRDEEGVILVQGEYTDEEVAQTIDDIEDKVRPDFLELMRREREAREQADTTDPPAREKQA